MHLTCAQSPPNSVGDGPLAAAMKDNHQTDRHAHFEDGSGDSNDSSAAAHRHAMEYDEVGWIFLGLRLEVWVYDFRTVSKGYVCAQVADVAESHLVRSANPGAHIFGNVVAAMGHELAQESRCRSHTQSRPADHASIRPVLRSQLSIHSVSAISMLLQPTQQHGPCRSNITAQEAERLDRSPPQVNNPGRVESSDAYCRRLA